MSSSQDLGFFVHNNTEAEAQRSYAHAVEKERAYSNFFSVLHQGYCNRKPPKS